MATFQNCITKFHTRKFKFGYAHKNKKILKSRKKSFIYKTGFSFKYITQTGKSPIMQVVTLNAFVGTLDLFTKRSIH